MEGGGSPAQLVVMGDWMGITKDGTPETWIAPATFICKYLPPGSPIPSGYEWESAEPISDLNAISEEAFGGDQNGSSVAPKNYAYMEKDNSGAAQDMRDGILRFFIDPSLSPEDIESHLKSEADKIWTVGSDEEYYNVVSSIFQGPSDEEMYEPNYVRLAAANKPFPRKIQFRIGYQ
jgi:hypothetical protein